MLGISHFGPPSNYLDQTTNYLWTLTRFFLPKCTYVEANQLFDFSVRGLEKRRSYRNRWTPILLDGKQQQMLWQCLLSPFFAVYLKLNYVEKVMKREIGNGFSDEATSSTWLVKSQKKKLQPASFIFFFLHHDRHQWYLKCYNLFLLWHECSFYAYGNVGLLLVFVSLQGKYWLKYWQQIL